MIPRLQTLARLTITAGVVLCVAVNGWGQDDREGIVRISKPRTAEMQRGTGPRIPAQRVGMISHQVEGTMDGGGMMMGDGNCYNGGCPRFCDRTRAHSDAMEAAFETHMYNTFSDGRACNPYCNSCGSCSDVAAYLRCKFGYFIPTGADGAGVPWVGKYSRVYPQDPHYFDQRDGQTYGAQGYGTPMAVPLAPVVGHTYNYGWGIPSSRLTPISRPAY